MMGASTNTTTKKCDVCNKHIQEKIFKRHLKPKTHLIDTFEKVKCNVFHQSNHQIHSNYKRFTESKWKKRIVKCLKIYETLEHAKNSNGELNEGEYLCTTRICDSLRHQILRIMMSKLFENLLCKTKCFRLKVLPLLQKELNKDFTFVFENSYC